MSGRQCLFWKDVFQDLNQNDALSIRKKVLFPDNSMDTLENNCRYLNKEDSTFPSCYVSTPEGGHAMENCEIERCGRYLLYVYKKYSRLCAQLIQPVYVKLSYK